MPCSDVVVTIAGPHRATTQTRPEHPPSHLLAPVRKPVIASPGHVAAQLHLYTVVRRGEGGRHNKVNNCQL